MEICKGSLWIRMVLCGSFVDRHTDPYGRIATGKVSVWICKGSGWICNDQCESIWHIRILMDDSYQFRFEFDVILICFRFDVIKMYRSCFCRFDSIGPCDVHCSPVSGLDSCEFSAWQPDTRQSRLGRSGKLRAATTC
jgi:hypothetical protein